MMRITSQLLRSRTSQPLHSVDYLDLSNLGLVSLERLELCPKLQTAIVRGNKIESVPDLRCCPQLWKIDLANNVVRSLEGLISVAAFGTLILANNDLDWNELQKIRHVHVLDLCLHGNHKLEMDAYYRMHVIDSLPLVWMLDGRIITSAERAQVEQFFKDSALSDRPVTLDNGAICYEPNGAGVAGAYIQLDDKLHSQFFKNHYQISTGHSHLPRHKLPKHQFVPSVLKNIAVTGVFGQKREHLMRRFPLKENLNVDLDKRRLLYLAYCLQQEVNLYMKNTMKGKVKPSLLIENLINHRNKDKERCNMLLLMLVASLEFAIPSLLIQQTLNIARLRKIRNVDTMDVFMLPRDIRCHVISLLLGAVKIERDQHIDGGLYNRLYLCLYDLVADLVRLANGDSVSKYQATRKRLDSRKSGYRCLLASEVVQLLCIVPVFFEFIGKDPGVLDLIIIATKDSTIGEKIKALTWKVQSQGGGKDNVSKDIAEYLLECVKDANLTSSGKRSKDDAKLKESLLENNCVEPSYVITSKRLVKTNQERPQSSVESAWSRLQRYDAAGGARNNTARAMSAIGVRTKQSAGLGGKRSKAIDRKPALGDRVEVGHQVFGHLAAIPETNIGLIQLDNVAASKFQQADYPFSHLDQQFTYVDFVDFKWDNTSETWKQELYSKKFQVVRNRKGSRSAPIDKRSGREGATRFLSDAIRKNLQLRVDLPVAYSSNVTPVLGETSTTGETVITDHVRSIVRECLQEADVQWISSQESDINGNYYGKGYEKDEQASDKQDDQTSPVVISEVTANSDSESTEDAELVEEDFETNMEVEEETPLMEGNLDEDEHSLDDCDSETGQYLAVDSGGLEEMMSFTEHARINAWKTSEVIKKAGNSGIPSRVGSATTRVNTTCPPPQRPSSPTHPGTIPFRQADRWLAGGRDVSSSSVKRAFVPLPGWMEGLDKRRPKSSPALRGPRQTSSPVASRTMLTRTTAGRPLGGAQSVFIRGSPPTVYGFQPTRVVVRRR